MRSDREEIPGGFSKEDADAAEMMEARLNTSRAAIGCQVFWPSPYEVCGAILDEYNLLGGPNSFLLYPTSGELTNPDGVGKRSQFLGGNIYWSPSSGAHFVAHDFLTKWGQYGYETGYMQYPLTDEIVNADGGRRQQFVGGMIYWSVLSGAHTIHGRLLDKWGELGFESGQLGYPTSDEQDTTGQWTAYGQRENQFQHGALYYDFATDTVHVGQWKIANLSVPAAAAGDLSNSKAVTQTANEPSATTDAEQSSGGIAPRFTSPCNPAISNYSAPNDIYNCQERYIDKSGEGVNVRLGRGDPNGFGQTHYKLQHYVEDRWVELILQDADRWKARLGDTMRYGYTGSVLDEYGEEFYVDEEHILGIMVIVNFGPDEEADAPDDDQFGVVTSFCYLPDAPDDEIEFCPTVMPPGPFVRTVPLGG